MTKVLFSFVLINVNNSFYLFSIHSLYGVAKETTSLGVVHTDPVFLIVWSFTDTARLQFYVAIKKRHLRHFYTKINFHNAVTGLSNPIRYPRFRVSASGVRQSAAFAFGIPHDINGFHPYSMSSTDPSHPQVVPFRLHFRG